MANQIFPPDAFGDRFELATLPLPRRAAGYAVQMLDTDLLLDSQTGEFKPVRSPSLQGLFDSFDGAYLAAHRWAEQHDLHPDTHPLAIVPAGYDPTIGRHVLIYGVLRTHP